MYGVFVFLNNMSKTTLEWQQKYWFSNQWKSHIYSKKKWTVKKSVAGFEPTSFSGPVPIQLFCNAIPTRPLDTWNGNDVKYTWTC